MRTELVTTLKRKATDLISQLATDQEPVLITQHGLPAAYLIDVQMYEGMQSRLTLLEGIARGEKAILEKRVLSHREAKQRMARWLA
jgi:prevent-host-death family protein